MKCISSSTNNPLRNTSQTHAVFRTIASVSLSALLLLLVGCAEVPPPSPHTPAVTARSLALGGESSCFLSAGRVYCWGEGSSGQLGDGLASDRIFPLPIAFDAAEPRFVQLSLAKDYACALRFNGALYCWGAGTSGALGNGGLFSILRPLAVKTLDGIQHKVRIFDTGLYHSCAVTTENALYCWGYNGNGQLGTGNTDSAGAAPRMRIPTPVQTATGADGKKPITSIATGGYHSCLTYSDGSAACWGHSAFGQLGNECLFGTLGENLCTTDRVMPTAIPYFDGSTPQRRAVRVFAGEHHSCIINDNEQLFCFGRGTDGRLGINATDFSHSKPQHVGNIPAPIRTLAIGNAHTCALLQTGEVYCFGDNDYGQLGNRSTVDSAIPVRVPIQHEADTALNGIATGAFHSCAWDTRAQYYCWGRNTSGQLGLGTQGGAHTQSGHGIY